jgi:hypothetical protein
MGAPFDVGLVRVDGSLAGDDGDEAVAVLLEHIRFVGVSLSATGNEWVVRLHEFLKPCADVCGLVEPLLVPADESQTRRFVPWRSCPRRPERQSTCISIYHARERPFRMINKKR